MSQAATTRSRGNWTRAAALQPLLVPLASLLVALTLLGTGWRLLLVVALPALFVGAFAHRLPRSAAAGAALLLGVLALGAGLIARADLLVVAGPLYRTHEASSFRRRRQRYVPICRLFFKPSDGLEPSTPSLPWRIRASATRPTNSAC